MCGRFVQFEGLLVYVEELSPQLPLFSEHDDIALERYNVAPTASVHIFRGADDGLHIDVVKWGWSPAWAKGSRPDPVNARVETVATGKFFKQLWPSGRTLVPCDGWYEWLKDPDNPKKKQPYFFRLKSRKPMFFGALAQVQPDAAQNHQDGFVIITTASASEMLAIHDRRPLVLSPELANQWIESGLSHERAIEIAHEGCLPTDAFEWFAVNPAVGNVRNQGPDLITPLLI